MQPSPTHPSLLHAPSNFVGGIWHAIPGSTVQSNSPDDPQRVIFSSASPLEHVDAAVAAARDALPAWSKLPRDARFSILKTYADLCKAHAGKVAELLCDEVGKVMWECKAEAGLLAAKVDITLDPAPEGGLRRVSDFDLTITPTRSGRCHFKPHGVMAVLGPFNFPAHLPNGHIVPALAMGNTVVFKPSDKAPAVGQLLVELFDLALKQHNAPPGVINLIQGGADVASKLAAHTDVDAVAFTGSWNVGRKILAAGLDNPGRIIALELGGNNAAVVMPGADFKLAAIEVVRSAFATTGQRCTCSRRVIVHRDIANKFIPLITKLASTLIVGRPRATHPVFMGPIISDAQLRSVLQFQQRAITAGATVLLESTAMNLPDGGSAGHYLTPGILSVNRFVRDADPGIQSPLPMHPGCDEEIFGPLLRVSLTDSLDDAIAQTNASRYGLAAAIFTADTTAAERFTHEVRAGCINTNTGTAGASSKLPFGGLGLSGNHRPAGSFAMDYCAYPVASMHEISTAIAPSEGMQFDEGWLR